MKLSFSTLGCPEWHWGDIVMAATDLGYDGIEIRGVRNELYAPRIHPFRPESLTATREQLKRCGLTLPCLTSACELQKPGESLFFECREYIDTAASLGVPYIRMLADEGPVAAPVIDVGRVKESAQILGAYAAQNGVTLLIESNGYFADTERLAKLLDDIHSPGVAALWDINHPFRFFQEPPRATVENLGKYIRHVHIKDSVEADGKVVYKIMGQGDLPVAECVSRLQDLNYDGFFSLEWVRRWQRQLEEPGIAFALFVQYMRGLL